MLPSRADVFVGQHRGQDRAVIVLRVPHVAPPTASASMKVSWTIARPRSDDDDAVGGPFLTNSRQDQRASDSTDAQRAEQ